MSKYYIVWCDDRKSGIIVDEKHVAYEARKGAITNCVDENGDYVKIARAFCKLSQEAATIQEVEI